MLDRGPTNEVSDSKFTLWAVNSNAKRYEVAHVQRTGGNEVKVTFRAPGFSHCVRIQVLWRMDERLPHLSLCKMTLSQNFGTQLAKYGLMEKQPNMTYATPHTDTRRKKKSSELLRAEVHSVIGTSVATVRLEFWRLRDTLSKRVISKLGSLNERDGPTDLKAIDRRGEEVFFADDAPYRTYILEFKGNHRHPSDKKEAKLGKSSVPGKRKRSESPDSEGYTSGDSGLVVIPGPKVIHVGPAGNTSKKPEAKKMRATSKDDELPRRNMSPVQTQAVRSAMETMQELQDLNDEEAELVQALKKKVEEKKARNEKLRRLLAEA